jgi:hypothetical protein
MGESDKEGTWTFKVKSGNAEEMPAPKWAEPPGPTYRIRVKLAPDQVVAVIALHAGDSAAPEPDKLANPTWQTTALAHGGKAEMAIEAPGLDGREVRFIVERHAAGEEWEKIAEQTAKVSAGKASASVEFKAEELGNPRYVREGALLAVDTPGIRDGRELKFTIEMEKDGQWQEQAPVKAVAKSGKAEAPFTLPKGKYRFHAEVVPELPDGNLRFHAELV